ERVAAPRPAAVPPAAEPAIDTAVRRPLPWKWIGGAGAAAALVAALFIWKSHPTPITLPPPPALLSVDVVPDPPGASVTVGGSQCVAPCALSLAPGAYPVGATLKDYEPKQDRVTLSDANHRIQLTLRALPPPPPPPGVAKGTLVVQTGAP